MLDSDKGTQEEHINKKHVSDLINKNIKAYVTRKREPENYISIDCIREKVFADKFTDTEDAKKAISSAIKMSPNDVLEKLWIKMSSEQIRDVESYIDDDGNERYEFTEMIEDFISMVE